MDATSVIVIVLLLLLALIYAFSYIKGRKYKAVTATVKEVEVSQRKRPENNEPFTAYVPIYGYEVDGVPYAARGAVAEDPEKHHVGDKREIIYNSMDPNEIHLYKRNRKERSIGLFLVLAGIAVILIAFLFKII